MGKKVTISKEEYEALKCLQRLMSYFVYFGIDSWNGYHQSVEMYNEDEDSDSRDKE